MTPTENGINAARAPGRNPDCDIRAHIRTGDEVTIDVVASEVRAIIFVVVGNDETIALSPDQARRLAAALLEVASRTPETETARKIRLATAATTEAIGQAGGLVGDPSRPKVTR